ncbi:PREDICTED: uncharacterized protein LOC109233527 [Nicotiana attenuata]|uniref:uncharacterized protein LOC109233527 n=1 Tax=Nicotiana attenuata TaxID=49451 RepID=UPI000904CB9D|nr:PREDICTED: uncharacterized protein LOC109233527 [Nicotiana attenuata]
MASADGNHTYDGYKGLTNIDWFEVVLEDEDLTSQVIELHPEATLPEALVQQDWNGCRYLKNGTQVPDVAKGEVDPDYAVWFERKSCASNEPEPEPEPERPEERPHIQAFDDKVRESRRRKKRLVQENKALRAQIQRMKIAAENPAKSRQDEKLINSLRRKVYDYGTDLEKAEEELAKTRSRLAQNAKGRAKFVERLKDRDDKEATVLKKKLTTQENEMAQQAKNFKSEKEHCYALISQLEESMQQLRDQNNADTQVLEARAQQIGRLL